MFQLSPNLINRYHKILENVVGFCGIMLMILIITRRLFYQLIYAFDPDAKSQRFVSLSRPVRIAFAIADILAWLLALITTCFFYQIPEVPGFVLTLLTIIGNLLPLVFIFVLILYYFSPTGNEMILSVLGFWYLHHRQEDLERCRYFDLGDGQMAEIEMIYLLDTTFRLKEGGQTVVRPNAYLMHQFFGFTRSSGIEALGTWIKSLTQSRRIEEIIMRQNDEIIRQNQEIIDILNPPENDSEFLE